ncbi:SNF2-related protein [Desulfobacterales bacterium HSG16]|nr:SNF2-related protein [Desulfobacterales bacterium HSG16]
MFDLTPDYIRTNVADSDIIYQRGRKIFEHGAFLCADADTDVGSFLYDVDGNYGDYTARINFHDTGLKTFCDCPYPGSGCKHTVAVLLDVHDQLHYIKQVKAKKESVPDVESEEAYLTPEQIREQAMKDRRKRAGSESFIPTYGDMFKGEHMVETPEGKQYQVTIHDPENENGHCSCPDFLTNRLNTCKHLIYMCNVLKKKRGYKTQLKKEKFPFVDIFWDSDKCVPRLFCERPQKQIKDIAPLLSKYFDKDGFFAKPDIAEFLNFLSGIDGNKKVRVREIVLKKINDTMSDIQSAELSKSGLPKMGKVESQLYPYQKEGIKFCLYKKAALIGDEMGLGKTLQAIMISKLKKKVFGFERVIVVTVASLKEQWKREIERFTSEKCVIVAGSALKRRETYENDDSLFKITNYEAVLRDVTIISRFKPDLIILDEAQRIKNFNTKTADAVKSIPRKHALVLTGTPLENKLEDVYSIVQFLDTDFLSPLWQFAADHFMLSAKKKGRILGYRNLNVLHEKLKNIVIRRRKEEVLTELPDEIVNNYYIDLTKEQREMHAGYVQSLLPILNKKHITPMDLRRIMELLLCMRMVCDSTYLIDKKTHHSPKLKELEGIVDELVIQSRRKVVIFSEWTTMTFLIAKHLSSVKIPFVELSGKVPVHKRQALIDEFTDNPDCKVFLSTDAGGTGLNLQAGDCVINFELPWNPAKMNQRIGRVNRIGQKSKTINVVNLIAKSSIEENILAGIQLKTDLFKGVFDGGTDKVEFSREKRTELLNRLRELMGEEALLPPAQSQSQEEIPEDTPHYLNPQVLEKDEKVDYGAEETTVEHLDRQGAAVVRDGGNRDPLQGQSFAEQPPEKIEAVLNSGMQFISGLMEMATGKKIETTGDDHKMISIDQNTGEVTMKFKMPF